VKTILLRAINPHKAVAVVFATLSGMMAFLALLAWVVGRMEWLSLGTGGVPTAPATSILLILLSTLLLAEISGSGNAALRRFCQVVAVLITVAGLAALLRPFFGWPSPLEQWLAGTARTLGNVPVGQISPLAGLAFLLTGSASWVKTSRSLNKQWSRRIEFGSSGLVFWISAAVILSYVAGTPLFSDHPIIPMALLTAVIFFFLSIAMALGYEPLESPAVSLASGGKKPLVNKPLWILASSLVVFLILIGGVVYLRGEETRIRKEKSEELAAIGTLKIDQILRWRKERLADIANLAEAPFLVRALEAWLQKPDDAALKKDIIQRLKLETRAGIYTQALLMDANAHVLLSFPETAEVIDEIRNAVKETWDRSGVFVSELHSGVPGEADVDIVEAVRGVSGQPLAAAVLTSDVREYIFPMIQTWPASSRSAETLLVRRDGNDALYLNDLRHRKNTALGLRLPLTEIKAPAVQAILGKTGPTIGPDYRGVEVFADLRPVPGTPWYLVTKVDTAEALAEVRFRAVMTFTIILSLVAGILGLIVLLYQIRLMEEREAAEHLKLNKQKLDLALKSARMGVWQFDLVQNKRTFDHQVCALLGIDPATFGGTAEEFFAAVHPEDRGKIREALARTMHDGILYEPEYRVVWSDGSIHEIAGRGELVFNDQGKPEMINGIIWDITERKRTEEALRKNEERFRLANKVTNDVVWDWDVIHDTQKWNESAAVIFGWTDIIERFQPAHWWVERVHPEDVQRVSDGFFAVVNDPEADYWHDEYRFRKADGSYAQVMDRGYVLRDKQGKALRMVGAMLDITERKKAEVAVRESETVHRKLFENSWDAMMILDPPSWRFASGNPSMLRMFGAKQETELLLHFPWTLSPDRQPDGRMSEEKSKAMIEIAVRQGHHFFEWVHKRLDGGVFPAEVLLTRTEKQGKLSLQASVRDITERKKAEEEIKKLNVELEERVRQRTAELSMMVKELEAFDYSVAHDLKAPLRAMTGFANILSEDYAPKLDENAKRVIGVISVNARNMGKMIDDLLTLSHLGRKDIAFVDIDMAKLAQDVSRELKAALFPDKAMEISVKPLPPARLDPTLAEQILTNLISNAMKFTARKEKAVIEIGGYDKDGERVYYVKDNGAGFDMKYADKLFGIFQRIHSQSEFGGTGIGLAIVRSAVVRLGGRVWAQGEVGQGATFYFTLPKGG
jgi:PAS domain S-box-containing protein